MAQFYAALFFALGIYTPYWPVWLGSHGLSPSDISWILTAGLASKIISAPIISHIIDSTSWGQRWHPLGVMALCSIFGFSLYIYAETFEALLVLAILTSIFLPNMIPVADAISSHYSREKAISYPHVRVWGSITFIIAAVGTGQLLDHMPHAALASLMLASLALLVLSSFYTPRQPRSTTLGRHKKAPLHRVLAHRHIKSILIAIMLIQAGHAAYYAISSLHWLSLGYSSLHVGLLWAWGVFAEIILFIWAGKHLTTTYTARALLIFTGACAALRWAGTATDPSLPFLYALQTLHGITFGLGHLSVQAFITRNIPADETATAQGIYSSLAMGIGHMAMFAAIGSLYELYGGGAFVLSAALSVLAVMILVPTLREHKQL